MIRGPLKTLLLALGLVGLIYAALPSSTTPAPQQLADSGGGCSNCAVEQPDTVVLPPTPEGDCSQCAMPTPPPQQMADGGACSSCAVEQPDAPAIPQTPEDGTGSCSSCATPTPPPAPQRADRHGKPRQQYVAFDQVLDQLGFDKSERSKIEAALAQQPTKQQIAQWERELEAFLSTGRW
jgi:hypothetical protein